MDCEAITIVKVISGQAPSQSTRGNDVFRIPAKYEVRKGNKAVALISSTKKMMGYMDTPQWQLRQLDASGKETAKVKYFRTLKEAKEAALTGKLFD